ncbi:chemotaxis protein CheB [Cryobacterium sp. MLB-32]|uniref:chemotaxis protein CheB n=1 Tax=Cryobacterium sp. MLB-32 TaxID=1529318 RepID=UPI00068ED4B8|nr:chemotaxis protein CheB [Cryobacterium sp. MLB-32]
MTRCDATAVRVLIVEDTPSRNGALTRALQVRGEVVVCAQTVTGAVSVRVVSREAPDVIVLSLSTDDGTGQRFIELVMALRPTPILVLSPRIENRQSLLAIQALVAGALETLPTPTQWNADAEAQLRRTIRRLSTVQAIRHPRGHLARSARRGSTPSVRQAVVALAASTGGPRALAEVLAGLEELRAPILVVQHLHPDFIDGFVGWMSRESALPVEMATHDQILQPGHVYLAPGHKHLRLAAGLRTELSSGPVTLHRPSADELFRSVAVHAGSAGVGVILTGMGDDGARGLLALQRAGGQTFGQDEASSAVFGMPQAAQQLGALSSLLPLNQLAPAIKRASALVQA